MSVNAAWKMLQTCLSSLVISRLYQKMYFYFQKSWYYAQYLVEMQGSK